MQSKLIKNFKNFIFQEKLFSGGEKLVVGISGGADSICLVKLLLEVQDKFNLGLQLVHINYHLRGEESDGDEEFVREFAKENGLKLEVVDYAKQVDGNNNLEERLRDFRYEVFEKNRKGGYFSSGSTTGNPVVEPLEDVKSNEFDWIVVAHHQDDQVETFFINLFRGAGAEGLKGMVVKNEDRKILRPLLNFRKKEIETFLEEIGQEYREDSSNKEDIFLRNRIRNELIPMMEEGYSSNIRERIGSTVRQLQEHTKIVERVVEEEFKTVVVNMTKQRLEIDVEKYNNLNDEIRPLIFRKMIKILKGNLRDVSRNNYLEFEKIMKSTKGKNQVMNIKHVTINRKGYRVICFTRSLMTKYI